MQASADILVALVALLHLYFLVLEMMLWDRPLGMMVFRMSAEKAAMTKQLAMNQGLYNGFLAAGLIWGLILGPAGFAINMFFLGCVVIAGAFGALTVSRRILWIQAAPAAIAMVLVYLSAKT
jgi:putative membrane protein